MPVLNSLQGKKKLPRIGKFFKEYFYGYQLQFRLECSWLLNVCKLNHVKLQHLFYTEHKRAFTDMANYLITVTNEYEADEINSL